METPNQNPEGAEPAPKLVRAAQYVRMYTEHQQYSTENQADVLREYAAKRGYEIVRTPSRISRGWCGWPRRSRTWRLFRRCRKN